MSNENEMYLRILTAEDAIKDVNFHINQNHGDSAIISAIEYAILCVESLSTYCNSSSEAKSVYECLKLLNFQLEGYKDSNRIYKYLRQAVEISESNSLDEYMLEEISDIIEEIKGSNNIFDKLAIAIFYINLGEEHYTEATKLLQEYLNSHNINPFITNKKLYQILEDISK